MKKKPDQLLDVLPVNEDEDERKSASISERISSLITELTTDVVAFSAMPLNIENSVFNYFQTSTDPPFSDLGDDDGSLTTNVHRTVSTRLGVRNRKLVRVGKSSYYYLRPHS